MIKYIKENHGNRGSGKFIIPVHSNERHELNFLKSEVKKMCAQLGIDEDEAKSMGSEMESESSDDDYVDELPRSVPSTDRKPRNSVSAEVFGEWNR